MTCLTAWKNIYWDLNSIQHNKTYFTQFFDVIKGKRGSYLITYISFSYLHLQ